MEGHGAGIVERNIAVSITIPKQENRCLQQKIITMIHVVGTKRDLSKKITVVEAVQVIVQSDGKVLLIS